MPADTPAVLFLTFNRPTHTRAVFEAIRTAKPDRFYIAGDGPRPGHRSDRALVKQTRSVIDYIDWPCEVRTLYRDNNLGCKAAVQGAIDWFFEAECEGIILEDDCLPSLSFFSFCGRLLEKYRTDQRVMAITGTNIMKRRIQTSYFFSTYALMWGWATWRRSWHLYDRDLTTWSAFKKAGRLKNNCRSLAYQLHWQHILEIIRKGEIDTWDYQWIYTCWAHRGLTAVPGVNLVRNIGYDHMATHTKKTHPVLSNLAIHEMHGALVHPDAPRPDSSFDDYVSRVWFRIGLTSVLRFALAAVSQHVLYLCKAFRTTLPSTKSRQRPGGGRR